MISRCNSGGFKTRQRCHSEHLSPRLLTMNALSSGLETVAEPGHFQWGGQDGTIWAPVVRVFGVVNRVARIQPTPSSATARNRCNSGGFKTRQRCHSEHLSPRMNALSSGLETVSGGRRRGEEPGREQMDALFSEVRSDRHNADRHGIAVLLVLLLCASLFLVYNGSFNDTSSRDANDTHTHTHTHTWQNEQLRRPSEAPPRARPHPPILQGYSGIIDHKVNSHFDQSPEGLCPGVSLRGREDDTLSDRAN
ncbi:hypothetical protein NQZ68_001223 [Dissostichus eleginoides]|nr:hypothetical protein NQZ68_001223 [Dissostichus eleginoides]